ncbi:MAG: AAA family ATPase [Rubrivivax sp.]|nr:AAA family ATPase [Rubrivivax sp.]
MATIRSDSDGRRRERKRAREWERKLERVRLLAALAAQPLMTSPQGSDPGHESPAPAAQAPRTRRAALPMPLSPGPALELLGAPRLLISGGEPVPLERRTAALLALLVLQGPTTRSRAAALVWPEADDVRASNSLRQRIYKLRRAAGRDVIVSERQIALAADIAHDLAAPLARLAEDPQACRGELLGGLDFSDCGELNDWVALARQRWRAELSQALAELASRWEAESRVAAAARLAERLVALEPTAEHAHRRVMRLHYLRGDRAAALAAFDRCRQILRAELGVLPDRETQQLQQAIEGDTLAAPRAAPPSPVTLLRPPRLVGRGSEWASIHRALEAGRPVLVVGEAGIGKSRLIADFAAHFSGESFGGDSPSRESAPVTNTPEQGTATPGVWRASGAVAPAAGLVVRARLGDSSVPWATLARLLRAALEAGLLAPPTPEHAAELARVVPELGTATTGALQPLRLKLAVQACLQARPAGPARVRLLALDDAQYADAATLEMLPGLCAASDPNADGGVAGQSLCWLVASRPGEMPAALRQWAATEDLEALARLTLGPLDEAAVVQLLESLALPGFEPGRWAAALLRHTGGNPMFILETLRHLCSGRDGAALATPSGQAPLPLPADVGSLIERRLAQLSPDALNLAQLAALAGQDFTPELAAQVLERRVIDLAQPWRELEAAQVIRDQAFAHDLVLEVAQRSVPQAVARALHRAIASVLQSAASASARVAEHWNIAEEFDSACGAFLAAADAARAVSRLDEELALVARAAECLRRGGCVHRLPAVLHREMIAAFELGHIERMRQLVVEIGARATTDADRLLALDARLRLQAQDLQFEAMLQTAAQALPLADKVGSDQQRCVIRELEATALARLSRPDKAVQALEFGFEWIRREPEHPWVSGFLCDAAGTFSYIEQYDRSMEVAEQAYAAAERSGYVRHMHLASAFLALARYMTGDIERSTLDWQRSRSLAERFGGDHLRNWVYGAGLSRNLRLLGRYDEAVAQAQTQLETWRLEDPTGGGWWRTIAELELAHSWFELGQIARALSALGAAPPENPDARFRWLLTRCRIHGDRPQEVRHWLDEARPLAAGGLRPRSKFWALAPELFRHMPMHAVAAMAPRLADEATQAGAHIFVWPIRARAIEAMTKAGCTAEAAAAARELLRTDAAATPCGLYLPEYWWILSCALRADGDHDSAQLALRSASDWVLRTALPNVAAPFRDSFLNRNAVNRAVLAAAARQGLND